MKARALNQQKRRLACCEGKERFESFRRARAVASRMAHRSGSALQAYSCHLCGGIHVGTPNGEGRGGRIDPRKPYAVFAKQGDSVEHYIGRTDKPDGGQLKEILALDGWEITRLVRTKVQR